MPFSFWLQAQQVSEESAANEGSKLLDKHQHFAFITCSLSKICFSILPSICTSEKWPWSNTCVYRCGPLTEIQQPNLVLNNQGEGIIFGVLEKKPRDGVRRDCFAVLRDDRKGHRNAADQDGPHSSASTPAGHEDWTGPLRGRLLPPPTVRCAVNRTHRQQVIRRPFQPLPTSCHWTRVALHLKKGGQIANDIYSALRKSWHTLLIL